MRRLFVLLARLSPAEPITANLRPANALAAICRVHGGCYPMGWGPAAGSLVTVDPAYIGACRWAAWGPLNSRRKGRGRVPCWSRLRTDTRQNCYAQLPRMPSRRVMQSTVTSKLSLPERGEMNRSGKRHGSRDAKAKSQRDVAVSLRSRDSGHLHSVSRSCKRPLYRSRPGKPHAFTLIQCEIEFREDA